MCDFRDAGTDGTPQTRSRRSTAQRSKDCWLYSHHGTNCSTFALNADTVFKSQTIRYFVAICNALNILCSSSLRVKWVLALISGKILLTSTFL